MSRKVFHKMPGRSAAAAQRPAVDADRRRLVTAAGLIATGVATVGGSRQAAAQTPPAPSRPQGKSARAATPAVWICTTKDQPWRTITTGLDRVQLRDARDFHVMISPQAPQQTMEGFGGCLHEKGWQALSALGAEDRETLLKELFAPGVGANLSLCRIPIGANDYALDWYSHNETPGDFTMAHFSIDRDRQRIIPFLKAAKALQPDLRLWASPWSPPTWMKTNKHYACARPRFGSPENGLRPDQVRREGQDTFIQEEAYFRAYALYFQRFVEAYGALDLPIGMVMPQNEFNSPQPFPSCTWTPQGLARFIPYLGDALAKAGTEVFFGTLERSDPKLFETAFADPKVKAVIKGVGVQWAGRQAAPLVHQAHPELRIVQSEQECGDGLNDWRFARFTWTLMKEFIRAGASTYDYWNIATPNGGLSTWGWAQNSMISVDLDTRHYSLNPDYYVFKHLSHFVKPGAKRVSTLSISGYENLLAFVNPNGQLVLVIQNDLAEPSPINLTTASGTFRAMLPADSFNTLLI